MKQAQASEPPSTSQDSLFMVGQDSHGNWVVQDQSGTRGGLFVDRLDALRYVRAETQWCASAAERYSMKGRNVPLLHRVNEMATCPVKQSTQYQKSK